MKADLNKETLKSRQFKLVDKVRNSKIKELELLNIGDIIEVSIPMAKITWPANHYAINVTVDIVNKGTSFTVPQGKFASIIAVFELEVLD